jgi:hypothetical protein
MLQMIRKTAVCRFSPLLLGGACLAPGLWALAAFAAPVTADVKPAETLSIKGTCTFGGRESTWSAKLTAKGDGLYDAVYVSSWGGTPLNYVGTIKTDLKTEISGDGKGSGGRSNGSFSFSGTYDTNRLARCSYKESGGRRSGTLTAELPR